MNCEFESRLSAYYDGELSLAEQAAVESHLSSCGDCREALASMRKTSALFAASQPAGLSQIARHRLHRNIDRQMERSLVRLSWAMSGIAAAIVVAGTLWLNRFDTVKYLPADPKSVATVIYPPSDAATPAEQYYLADATVRTVEEY
jgi:anti-sigma factor RsiW